MESIDFLGYFVMCVDIKSIEMIGLCEFGVHFENKKLFCFFLICLE